MKSVSVFSKRQVVRLGMVLAMANLFSTSVFAESKLPLNPNTSDVSDSGLANNKKLAKKASALVGIERIKVTASRIETLIEEIPASVSVIDRESLEQLNANKLSDLLRYQAGVSVQKSGDRHGDANISIRGVGGNRILMVKDGIIMPDGFGSAGVSQGRGNFEPFNLQQVEILKGPASALYGSNALGGVVVMNTIDPQLLLKENNNESYLSLNSGYFSEDERFRLGTTAATELAGGHLLFQAQHQTFHETDKNSDFVVNPKKGESNSFFTKWKYSDDGQAVKIIADYFNQEVLNQLDTNIGPIAGPPGTEISDSTANDDSLVWRLSFQHEIFDLALVDSFKWQVDYQYANYEQFEEELTENKGSTFPPIPASKTLTNEWEDFEQKQLSFNVQVNKEYKNHQLLAGIDYLSNSIIRPIERLNTDLITGSSTTIIDGFKHPGKTFPDADITQIGAFLQDYITFSDNLTLVMGIRYDKFENSPKPDEAYQNFNVSNAEVSDFSDSAVSPHLGVVYKFTENTSLFANITSGFRAPPIAEQYISRAILVPVPGVPHEVIPNNSLSSETSQGRELGLRWKNGMTGIELSVFQNNYEDFIDSKTIGYREMHPVFTGPLAIRQIQYQNVDEVEIKGVELSAHLQVDQWLPTGWQGGAHLAASFIDGENSTDGIGLNSVPPNMGVLGINIAPNDNIKFDWHIHVSDRAKDAELLFVHGQSSPVFEPAGYTTHDISVRYLLAKELALSLSIYNLTDKKYWGSHTKGDSATGDLDATVSPGRNFAVTASYSF